MGRNLGGDAHGSSGGRSTDRDDVFVPHYQRYAHSLATNGAKTPVAMPRLNPKFAQRLKGVEKSSRVGLLARLSSTSPSTAASHGVKSQAQPWQISTNDGFSSTTCSLDNVQESWVGVHQHLSEFQVALRASERAREDGEREMKALRLYVANVEAAAAGLLTRIQDLEGLLSLSLSQEHDVDQLRGKVATETLKELQKQVAAAAQAIAAAREATMKLDKVKRESHALTKAQEVEIGRLSRESTECRILYEARGKQIQELADQVVRLNVEVEDSQRTSQLQLVAYQKRFESAKVAAMEKAEQCDDLMRALELSTAVGKAAEQKLEELLHEKKDILLKNELLEQQVKDLQTRGRFANYDHELCQVRAALGGEKAHLLDDLAHLRRSQQSKLTTPRRETMNSWHETPTPPQWSSDQHSAISQQSTNAQLVTKRATTTTKKRIARSAQRDESPPASVETRDAPQGSSGASRSGGCNLSQEEVDQDGRRSVSSSISASRSWDTNASSCTRGVASPGSCSREASHAKEFEQSVCRTGALYRDPGGHVRTAQFGSSQNLDTNEEDSEGSEATSTEATSTEATIMSSGLKGFSLLAAAQHEISKLKEACAF